MLERDHVTLPSGRGTSWARRRGHTLRTPLLWGVWAPLQKTPALSDRAALRMPGAVANAGPSAANLPPFFSQGRFIRNEHGGFRAHHCVCMNTSGLGEACMTSASDRRGPGGSQPGRSAASGGLRSFVSVTGLLLAGLSVAAVLSLGIGRAAIPPGTVIAILASRVIEIEPHWTAAQAQIVTGVRLPRILAAMLVGAALAAAGAAYQTLFRNPIVSPDVLGVSAGAGFGASLAVMANLGAAGIQGGAFAMGLAAVGLCFAIGQAINRHSLIVLVLVGVVIAAFFQAMISVLKIVADPIDVLAPLARQHEGVLRRVPDVVGFLCVVHRQQRSRWATGTPFSAKKASSRAFDSA